MEWKILGMAPEEQKDRCYDDGRFGNFGAIGGINARSSKKPKPKPKPKKVPQRGLGVAQLEKIRLEEQQKNDGPANLSSPSSPMSPIKSSSYLSLPMPNFCQSSRSSPSSSFPSPPPVNLSSSSSIFGPPLPVLNMPVRNSSTIPAVNQANSGGSETGLSAITVLEQGNALKMQHSSECFLEENYRVDPGLAFRSSFDFPYEVNPCWPSPDLVQRSQQYQSLPPMANISSRTSSSPSGLNVQIEPPSNQSYLYGNYSTLWKDKEEKRYNHRWQSIPSKCRDDNTPSSLTYNLAPSSFRNIKDDDVGRNFLTLASVSTSWINPSSNDIKCPSIYPLLQNLRHADSESLPFQGRTNPTRLDEKKPFYSFLPPAEAKIGQETAVSVNKCNGVVAERVDLDLKL